MRYLSFVEVFPRSLPIGNLTYLDGFDHFAGVPRASYLRYVDEFAIGSCGWTYAVATVALAADAI